MRKKALFGKNKKWWVFVTQTPALTNTNKF